MLHLLLLEPETYDRQEQVCMFVSYVALNVMCHLSE
jgi:hypothetical protein